MLQNNGHLIREFTAHANYSKSQTPTHLLLGNAIYRILYYKLFNIFPRILVNLDIIFLLRFHTRTNKSMVFCFKKIFCLKFRNVLYKYETNCEIKITFKISSLIYWVLCSRPKGKFVLSNELSCWSSTHVLQIFTRWGCRALYVHYVKYSHSICTWIILLHKTYTLYNRPRLSYNQVST